MSIIRFENVHYIYGQNTTFAKQALKNISFSIEKGSFVGLIGHTGSGKSTLIQHMNGLMAPSSGKVYFKEENITDSGCNRRDLCAKVGLVFQYPEYQLFETDVLRDVAFGPKNLGLTSEEAECAAREALKLVGMDEADFGKSPFELSGGQKRKAAIAGVLAMKPEVLVLDEPAAGLDPQGKKEILGLIWHLYKETSMTVILSSHSMDDMALYANRLLVMNEGEIVMDGAPAEIFQSYKYLESIGLSAPQMTYTMHALAEKGYPVSTKAITVSEASEEIMKLWRHGRDDT
jgi:energy-coupling factor transport system ATP-binding protein